MVQKAGEAKPENTQPARSISVEKIIEKSQEDDLDAPINKYEQPQNKPQVLQQDGAVIVPNIMTQTRLNSEKIHSKAGKKQAQKGRSQVIIEYRTQYMKNAQITVFSDSKGLYVSIAVEDENVKKLLSENISELSGALEKEYKIRSILVQKRAKKRPETVKNQSKTVRMDLRI